MVKWVIKKAADEGVKFTPVGSLKSFVEYLQTQGFISSSPLGAVVMASSATEQNVGPHSLEYYNLPEEWTKREGANLIQTIREALVKVLGEEKAGQAIINPFHSISYLFKDGRLFWKLLGDIDVKILLPDECFEQKMRFVRDNIIGESYPEKKIENNETIEKIKKAVREHIESSINNTKPINVQIALYSLFLHKEYGYDFVSDLFGQPKALLELFREPYAELLLKEKDNNPSIGHLIHMAIDNFLHGKNIIKAAINPGELKIPTKLAMRGHIRSPEGEIAATDEELKGIALPYEGLKKLVYVARMAGENGVAEEIIDEYIDFRKKWESPNTDKEELAEAIFNKFNEYNELRLDKSLRVFSLDPYSRAIKTLKDWIEQLKLEIDRTSISSPLGDKNRWQKMGNYLMNAAQVAVRLGGVEAALLTLGMVMFDTTNIVPPYNTVSGVVLVFTSLALTALKAIREARKGTSSPLGAVVGMEGRTEFSSSPAAGADLALGERKEVELSPKELKGLISIRDSLEKMALKIGNENLEVNNKIKSRRGKNDLIAIILRTITIGHLIVPGQDGSQKRCWRAFAGHPRPWYRQGIGPGFLRSGPVGNFRQRDQGKRAAARSALQASFFRGPQR